MCLFSQPKAQSTAAADAAYDAEAAQANQAAAASPDYSTAQSAQDRRVTDDVKSAGSTVLTTAQGVTSKSATKTPTLSGSTTGNTILAGAAGDGSAAKKTLLGQ